MKQWTKPIPQICNICGKPIRNDFVDGKTLDGPWAIMHQSCHKLRGVGLGLGKGQLYRNLGNGWFSK